MGSARWGGFIAVIERPAVIRQILDHVGLPSATPSLRAPPDQPAGPAADPPREWSYEPCFDLPVRRTQTGDLPSMAGHDLAPTNDHRGQAAGHGGLHRQISLVMQHALRDWM